MVRVEGIGVGRPKQPAGTQKTWDMHIRFDPNLRAVVQQVMIENRCSTPSELMRVLLERECRRVVTEKPSYELPF